MQQNITLNHTPPKVNFYKKKGYLESPPWSIYSLVVEGCILFSVKGTVSPPWMNTFTDVRVLFPEIIMDIVHDKESTNTWTKLHASGISYCDCFELIMNNMITQPVPYSPFLSYNLWGKTQQFTSRLLHAPFQILQLAPHIDYKLIMLPRLQPLKRMHTTRITWFDVDVGVGLFQVTSWSLTPDSPFADHIDSGYGPCDGHCCVWVVGYCDFHGTF